jgi:hypothetical protein
MRSTERRLWRHVFSLAAVPWVRAAATLLFLFAAAMQPAPVHAQSQELIVDGDFELGGVNWGVSSTFPQANSGGWFLSSVGIPGPLSGFATDPDGGGQNLYVLSDQLATGTMALFQTFTVPNDESFANLYLSFDMFVNDWSGQSTYNPNQHARVDIIAATGTAHLAASLFNAYLGTDGGPVPAEFRHYEFDVLPFLTPGQTYRLRFQTVVGVSQLNQGVDNVSILAVPEPGTLPLAIAGCVAFAGVTVLPNRSLRRPRSAAS